jgi:hypothetical protein
LQRALSGRRIFHTRRTVGRGRPRKILDASRVTELAAKGYSVAEIAAICGVSDDTLHRNFAVEIARGRMLCEGNLRAKQFEIAMSGNVRMLIYLGRIRLGQRPAPALCPRCQRAQSGVAVPHAAVSRSEQRQIRPKTGSEIASPVVTAAEQRSVAECPANALQCA